MSNEPENLKPCPCCGNKHPFTYITFSCAVLRCDCGLEIHNGAVSVVYQWDEIPKELIPFSYEPTLLEIKQEDGPNKKYPDHGYIGVNVMAAFEHAGLTKIWNTRSNYEH